MKKQVIAFFYIQICRRNYSKINTGLFEGTNEKVIYSKDFAAQFNVKKN